MDIHQLISQGESNCLEFKGFETRPLVHFDSSPVEFSTIEDLECDSLNSYWSTYYNIDYGHLSQDERIQLLKSASILTTMEENDVATVAGLLIFGRKPQQKLLNAGIVFASFRGKEITDPLIDKKEFDGNLPRQIDQVATLLNLLLPIPSDIEGLKRIDKPEIPKQVIRELIVNAVLHRDYSIRTKRISVYLFQDRLQISSPGRIANTLDLEKIRVGNSAPRNFLLLKFMDNMRYIDGLGRGIPMVIREMGERVHFNEIGDEFRVTVWFREPLFRL